MPNSIKGSQQKCYQCRKDKKRCNRREQWPSKCDRCRNRPRYQCSRDLTMAQYQDWQVPVSAGDIQAPTMEANWNMSWNASGTTPFTTNSGHSNINRQRTPHTEANSARASISRPTEQVPLIPTPTIPTIDNNSVSVSLGPQMNNNGQDSRTGGSIAPEILRIRTAEQLEAERITTAESLYTAIREEDHQQVRNLVAIDDPNLNPMKNESTRSQAVREALEKVSSWYLRSFTNADRELSKLPAILHELLENGGADHVVRYRFAASTTILHRLSRQKFDRTNVDEIFAVLANLSLAKLNDLIVAANDGGASFIHCSFAWGGFRGCFKPFLPKALQPLTTICNMQDDHGNLPLHIKQRDPGVFNFLLQHTENPFTLNHDQQTPLHTLVTKFHLWEDDYVPDPEDGFYQVHSLLLRLGGVQDVIKSVRDAEGRTLLHLCSDLRILRELTKPKYGFLTLIDGQDAEGRTPLVHAISCGCYHGDGDNPPHFSPSMWFVAEHFILCGADVSINDRFGRNALHWLLDAVDESIQHSENDRVPPGPWVVTRALRNCRMARRLTTRLLMKGVGVDDQDLDGTSAKSLAEEYWDRWEKSGMFKPCIWTTYCKEVSSLYSFFSPNSYDKENFLVINYHDTDYQEATSPELARLRSEFRRSGLGKHSPPGEWAEVTCRIIKGDLETLVNAIQNKSTGKRKRNSISGSVSGQGFAGSGIMM